MPVLFLLFIALPILELYLLFQVGDAIGFLPTIALILGTGALGVYVLRRHSFKTFQRARGELQSGGSPAQGIFDSLFIPISGVLLLLPGFITDVLALVLLLPFIRRALVKSMLANARFTAFSQSGGGFTFTHMGGKRPPHGPTDGNDVYEGEFTREQDPNQPRIDRKPEEP